MRVGSECAVWAKVSGCQLTKQLQRTADSCDHGDTAKAHQISLFMIIDKVYLNFIFNKTFVSSLLRK